MKHQEALRIPWIHKFIKNYIAKTSSDREKLVEMDNEFYIKYSDSYGIHFDIIDESPLDSASKWNPYIFLLNTCILFEERDGDPMVFYPADSKARQCDRDLYQWLCLDKLMKNKD